MRKILLVLPLLLFAAKAEAQTTRTVCASGCDHTTLAAAAAAAVSGDTITMAEDETFTACTVLPNKGNLASPITIRSSAANGNLPAVGVRFSSATHGTRVAIMAACTGGTSAISFAAGAQDYVIGPGLRFPSTPGGFGAMITVGSNSSSQDLRAEQPQDIVIDRNWLDGDPVVGQKVGVDINGVNITVSNNYIDGIHGVSQDAIGVRCVNGTGPYTITNNFIAAAAENFLCGGDDPQIRTFAVVNAGATTTTATLSSLSNGHAISELWVGQLIAFLAGGNTARYHTTVRECGSGTTNGTPCSSASIRFDAVPTVPDTGTGSDARWGAIPDNIRIRRNHFYKRLAWRDPILGTVGTVTPSATGSNGTLAAGTYYYRVVARNPNGYSNNAVHGTASAEVSCTVTAGQRCDLSWTAITNATHYRVFRGTAPGAQTGYLEVSTNSAADTGTALTASTFPTVSKWSVKNLFEIKFGTNYQIDSNIFENSWTGVDNGDAIWLKSNNSGGSADFAQTKNVIFERNKIFNVPGCFNILGRISNGNDASAVLENLVIRNNACYDSNSSWLDPDDAANTRMAINLNEPVQGVTIENNTFIHTMKGFMYLIGQTPNAISTSGLVVRNNIGLANTYGIFCTGQGTSCTSGTAALEIGAPGWVYAGNVLCGAPSASYPTGNLYPTCAEFTGSTHFTDYANDDYTLKVGSSWKGTAVGGGDPGANWAVLNSATTGVTTGAAESATPVDITTTTPITPITQGAACSLTFAATGGTGPYTWVKNTGTYPTGCTVSSGGVFSGTTTTPGTFTFTMRATDSASAFDDQSYTWVINPASATLAFVTAAALPATELNQNVSIQLEASGGTPPYSYDVSSGAVPTWATLSAAGLYSGVPSATTAASFTGRVTDAVGATATRTFTQTVANETMTCSGATSDRLRYYRVNGLTFEGSIFRRPTAPLATNPDCAKKGDLWENTATGVSYKATSSSPLTWSIADSQGAAVAVDCSPSVGDLIVGGDAGSWRCIAASEASGFDASAIVSGTFDVARMPPTGWAIVQFHVPETQSYNWVLPVIETELINTASKRVNLDTRGMTQVQLKFRVQGANTSVNSPRCYAKYSLNDSTFTAITGGDVSLSVSGTKAGAWATVPAAAQTESTIWSVWCIGGDGSDDVAVGTVALQFK